MKQRLENLMRFAKKWTIDAFKHEWSTSGAMVIPEKRTVICSYPKAGTTTTKWILLALLGFDKSRICSKENFANVHLNVQQYFSHGMQLLSERYPVRAKRQGHYRQGWIDDNWLGPSRRPGPPNQTLDVRLFFAPTNVSNLVDLVGILTTVVQLESCGVFLGSELDNGGIRSVTMILLVYYLNKLPDYSSLSADSDPWYRVISMYHHQLVYLKRLPANMTYENRSDFITFVKSYAVADNSSFFRHTGSAVGFCGMKYVDYDVYIDIDNIAEGLQELVTLRPDLADTITKGWETCTVDKSESLIQSQTVQEHSVTGFQSVESKLRYYDSLFCDNYTTETVYQKFRSDYDMFTSHGLFSKHTECLHLHTNVSSSSDSKDLVTAKVKGRRSPSLLKINVTGLTECWFCGPNNSVLSKPNQPSSERASTM